MRLLFKQKMFSWLDCYDIYDESGNTLFYVKGKLSWGHRLEIHNYAGEYLGMIKEVVFTFLPRFEMHINSQHIGDIRKELTFFRPIFTLDCNGWQVNGDLWQWNYEVNDPYGNTIMRAEKQFFNWADTYVIDVRRPEDALISLMIVLAIDAAKCSQNSG